MGNQFQLAITRQGWISPDEPEHDLCSHGDVRVVIGGEVIANGRDGEYGISEGALALLRTLDASHTARDRVAERLIPHGCGAILMMGCPAGLDWEVRHNEKVVLLSNPTLFPTTSEADAVRSQITVHLPFPEYRRAVVAFATEAKKLFDDFGPKVMDDDWHRDQYEKFWTEFDALLAKHELANSG